MCDRISQLEEKNRVMDKLILNLKNQLEENEWTVCQKNGEIALLKSQLKEASVSVVLYRQTTNFQNDLRETFSISNRNRTLKMMCDHRRGR